MSAKKLVLTCDRPPYLMMPPMSLGLAEPLKTLFVPQFPAHRLYEDAYFGVYPRSRLQHLDNNLHHVSR